MSAPKTQPHPDVKRLRDALAEWSRSLSEPHVTDRGSSFTPDACREVFEAAGVAIPSEAFDEVAKTFRQMPFYGGNYTLDARRLLRTLEAQR